MKVTKSKLKPPKKVGKYRHKLQLLLNYFIVGGSAKKVPNSWKYGHQNKGLRVLDMLLKLNIKGEWSDHFYRLVTSRQPSMQQQLLCLIFILIFLKESALAIDLCLFIQCNPQNENGSGRSDSGPTVIQIDQDWIQPENSQNDQLYHFGNNANSMNW